MADEDNKPAAADANVVTGQFAVQKVYVKDISFEAPHAPEIFQDQWEPQVNMELSNDSKKIKDTIHDVTLGVTLTVTANEKTIYLAEVKQAGIFLIDGFPDEAVKRILMTACPNMLFPFARELVADMVARGGFPQLLLAPVNFDALYMQRMQEQEANANKTTH